MDRQTCKICGSIQVIEFHVDDFTWGEVIPCEFSTKTVCIRCFNGFAKEKNIKYLSKINFFAICSYNDSMILIDDDPEWRNKQVKDFTNDDWDRVYRLKVLNK